MFITEFFEGIGGREKHFSEGQDNFEVLRQGAGEGVYISLRLSRHATVTPPTKLPPRSRLAANQLTTKRSNRPQEMTLH